MRRRAGVSAASVIVFALTVVLLAATATYLSATIFLNAYSAKRAGSEAMERYKYGLRATILAGIPPGVSPKAWLVIHQQYGVGETIRDIILDRDGSVVHRQIEERLDEGECLVMRLERFDLPRLAGEYINATLVIHAASGAVEAARERAMEPDELYPCRIDPPVRPGVFTINIRVVLEDGGDRSVCGECRDAVSPGPGSHMADPHTIVNLTARQNITRSGALYVFDRWEIRFPSPREYMAFHLNPLPLFADDHYLVDAVYVRV